MVWTRRSRSYSGRFLKSFDHGTRQAISLRISHHTRALAVSTVVKNSTRIYIILACLDSGAHRPSSGSLEGRAGRPSWACQIERLRVRHQVIAVSRNSSGVSATIAHGLRKFCQPQTGLTWLSLSRHNERLDLVGSLARPSFHTSPVNSCFFSIG